MLFLLYIYFLNLSVITIASDIMLTFKNYIKKNI
jgi:hypothetical protein